MAKKQKIPLPLVLSVAFVLIAGVIVYISAKPQVIAPEKKVENITNTPTAMGNTSADGIIIKNTPYSGDKEINVNNPHIHVSVLIAQEKFITPGVINPESFRTGTTALEALEKKYVVEKKGDGVNAFVTSIGGVKASDADKTFWAFYINGKQATVGAGSYKLHDGDVMQWKLEKY